MRRHRLYKITISDRSRLETIASVSLTPRKLILSIVGISVISLLIAGLLIMLTPLHELLPGYLKKSERAATQENLMRVDSIYSAFKLNQAYIDNILNVTDPDRVPAKNIVNTDSLPAISADSLLKPSAEELEFENTMRRRERYHRSVIAPLAAEKMNFSPVAETAVFLSDSREKETAEIVISDDNAISAIADASVIAVYFSPAENGYVIVMQHTGGFVSRLSHLGSPLVPQGDIVNAGQAVALPSRGAGREGRLIRLQLWHNGLPVIPYQYVGGTPP